MSERLYEFAYKAWPWLFVSGGYVLGVVGIFGMWDRPPDGGEPPLLWSAALLVWIVAHPTAIWTLWQQAELKAIDSVSREPDVEDG